MEGKLCIFRESQRVETYHLDGNVLHFVRPSSHLIFALTDNWKVTGQEVDWGLEPIMQKLKQNDLWNRDIVADVERRFEEVEKSKDRERLGQTEDFMREFVRDFKTTFEDVNTANLSKVPKNHKVKTKKDL